MFVSLNSYSNHSRLMSISRRHPQAVRFSAEVQPVWPIESDETPLSRIIIHDLLSLPMWFVPKRVFRALEKKYLYVGSNRDLRTTLETTKTDRALSDDKQAVLKSIHEVRFKSDDGIENYGWYHPAQPNKPTILLSMGNTWPITKMLNYFPLMQEGYGMMTYEYPGYGSTAGQPSEKALYQSLEAASDFLATEKGISLDQQVAYGVSLGGAVSTDVAARRKFKALIIESSLSSFPDVVKHKFAKKPLLGLLPIHKFVLSKLDSASKIHQVHCPILIMHATSDPMMPRKFADLLFNNATHFEREKTLRMIPFVGHKLDPAVAMDGIREFLNRLSRNEPAAPVHALTTVA